jgi:hypothetical protein
LPFHVSLDQYEDLLSGGTMGATWVSSTRVFLRNVRSFFLFKEGVEASNSHSVDGLACEIHVAATGPRGVEGRPVVVDATITNNGTARWLASDLPHGGVSLGAHLYDQTGRLLRFGVYRGPLTIPPREIAPGESVTCRVILPPQPAGRYVVECDCVSSQVMWFAQLGSRPARFQIEVVKAR